MQAWWNTVLGDYALERHHLLLLELACRSFDRCNEARRALAEHGTTFIDASGNIRPRPEVNIERDSRIAFARLVRELDLDVDTTVAQIRQPPALRSNRRVIGAR